MNQGWTNSSTCILPGIQKQHTSVADGLVSVLQQSGSQASRRSAIRCILAFLLFTLFFGISARHAHAQDIGTILGSVQDASDAIVPGATIVVTIPPPANSRTVSPDHTGA